MKNLKFLLLVLATTAFISTSAQIKLKDSGKISIGTLNEAPSGYTVWIYGSKSQVGGWNNKYIKYDLTPSDPRLYSTTSKFVFYNTDSYRHCDVEARSFKVASDARYKNTIETIEGALDKVMNLNGVSYYWNDEAELKSTEQDHAFGFIAQEVEQIIPEIVDTDSLGYKTMDYMQVMPYVVESIKELNSKVETQAEYIQELEAQVNVATTTGRNLIEVRNESRLLANQPNPFSNETTISYYVANTASNAHIAIYDLNGKQLIIKNIINFGSGDITVKASELYTGKFLYSLIVDGIEIDTKKMIITN